MPDQVFLKIGKTFVICIVLLIATQAFPYNILWDTYHGVSCGCCPSKEYSDLSTLLTGIGYTIDENDSGIMSVDLFDYCLVVVSACSAMNSAYTVAEVDKIRVFRRICGYYDP